MVITFAAATLVRSRTDKLRLGTRSNLIDGEHLSQFEREALIERHCELFGIWPE